MALKLPDVLLVVTAVSSPDDGGAVRVQLRQDEPGEDATLVLNVLVPARKAAKWSVQLGDRITASFKARP